MAFNRYMHSRNIYRKKPNFKELASKYPEFCNHLVEDSDGKVRLDFKNDPEAVRTLTTTLLLNDFNLQVTIPPDRLVPTLPLRLNYLLWIEDLLCTLTASSPVREVLGVDIGTGATCIYPLLGCRMNSNWRFLATDTDDLALDVAKSNVHDNHLQQKIDVIKITDDDRTTVLSSAVSQSGNKTIDFSMCNPPFYANDLEVNYLTCKRTRSSSKRPPPSSINHARSSESITDGGELTFVANMIKESAKIKQKIRIYTSMLGKKSSVSTLVEMISRELGASGCDGSIATTQFCQGNTMRWGVAWTFLSNVHLNKVAPSILTTPKVKNRSAIGSFVVGRSCHRVCDIFDKIQQILTEIKISISDLKTANDDDAKASLQFKANVKTWSHQRRQRRQSKRFKLEESPKLMSTMEVAQPALVEGQLTIREFDDQQILVEVQLIGRSLGDKESAHQIIQFLKNKLACNS